MNLEEPALDQSKFKGDPVHPGSSLATFLCLNRNRHCNRGHNDGDGHASGENVAHINIRSISSVVIVPMEGLEATDEVKGKVQWTSSAGFSP